LTIKPVSIEQIKQLSQAKKVEFKVCNDEFTATSEEVQDFGTFFSRLHELTPKKSP
jgi:hypothetical protein